MRFDQPDYSRPGAGTGVRTLGGCVGFIRHLLIIAEECALALAMIVIYSAFFGSSQAEFSLLTDIRIEC
jgi:hypothetical protein